MKNYILFIFIVVQYANRGQAQQWLSCPHIVARGDEKTATIAGANIHTSGIFNFYNTESLGGYSFYILNRNQLVKNYQVYAEYAGYTGNIYNNSFSANNFECGFGKAKYKNHYFTQLNYGFGFNSLNYIHDIGSGFYTAYKTYKSDKILVNLRYSAAYIVNKAELGASIKCIGFYNAYANFDLTKPENAYIAKNYGQTGIAVEPLVYGAFHFVPHAKIQLSASCFLPFDGNGQLSGFQKANLSAGMFFWLNGNKK